MANNKPDEEVVITKPCVIGDAANTKKDVYCNILTGADGTNEVTNWTNEVTKGTVTVAGNETNAGKETGGARVPGGTDGTDLVDGVGSTSGTGGSGVTGITTAAGGTGGSKRVRHFE